MTQPILQSRLPFAPWMDPRTARLPGILPVEGADWLRVDDAFALQMAERDARIARSGEPRAISQRLQFLLMKEDGSAVDGGSAPYLDYRPITAEVRELVASVMSAPWLASGVEQRALGFAIASFPNFRK